MRVVGVSEFGGPEALEVVEVPDPVVGPGEVRIRVQAAAVNPTDTFHWNGARAEMLRKDPPPYVPGMDAAGVVDQIGAGVTTVAVGDEVMAMIVPSGTHGAYASLVVVPQESVTHIPRGATIVEAATLPMNGLTAQLTLDLLALPTRATLAVTGAAGAYGGYVVQLAKAAGLRVIADASETDEALVRSLGADVVVRRGADVADRILAACPGGVDALADGSVQQQQVMRAVRDGGGFACVRVFEGTAERGITVHPVWVREYVKAHDELDRLRSLTEEGRITLRVARTFRAEDAPEAHRVLMAGGTRGRLVLEL